jgi:hypothetical protein
MKLCTLWCNKVEDLWLNKENSPPQHVFLCNQNVCSPAWDNNVIGQNESYFRLVSWDFIISEFLSLSVFFPQVINLA